MLLAQNAAGCVDERGVIRGDDLCPIISPPVSALAVSSRASADLGTVPACEFSMDKRPSMMESGGAKRMQLAGTKPQDTSQVGGVVCSKLAI